jgi:large conductance mechanosensitive channel
MADEEKKSLFQEFKEFIDKGNAMDMAVGVVIGGAFTAIVTSLTTDIINPLISLLTGGAVGEDGMAIPLTIAGFNIGGFISAIINFLIIALVVFMLIKSFNSMKNAASNLKKKEEEEGEPEMEPPTCPFCMEEVKEGATRCPHCAGAFDAPAEPKPAQ